MTQYANPGTPDAIVNFRERYENYIGGQWVLRSTASTWTTSPP